MVINKLKVHVIANYSHVQWSDIDSVFGLPKVHLGMYQRVYEIQPDFLAVDTLQRASQYLLHATAIAAWADDGVEIGANVTHRGKQCGALVLPYPEYDWDEADENPEYMDFVMYTLNQRVEWAFQAAQQMWFMNRNSPT